MRKTVVMFVVALLSVSLFSEKITINRDKTILKSGPGCFYDNLVILRINSVVDNIGPAEDDDGWLKVNYKGNLDNKKIDITGYLSKLSVSAKASGSGDPFDSLRGVVNKEVTNQIAPGAYTAAIKGFLLNYTVKKGGKKYNYDDIYSYTNFTKKDYRDVMRETDLSYFPRSGELLGLEGTFITESMEALSAAVVSDVISRWSLSVDENAVRGNVIANIINRQTIDYDKRYFVWIVKDIEPFAFSGPGGAIFISEGLIDHLTDYRELVAVIAHEVGHIALRHGVRDLAIEQARLSMKTAYDELDESLDSEGAALSADLENFVDEAVNACVLVRDDKEEFEADAIAMELLRRYKIDKKYLHSALVKIQKSLVSKGYKDYKNQTVRRLEKIK